MEIILRGERKREERGERSEDPFVISSMFLLD